MTAQWRIWIGGQGGQGVHFMADLLCRSALSVQLYAQTRSDSEWAIRGGRVMSTVLIHPQPFDSMACIDFNCVIYLHPQARLLQPPCAPNAHILDAYADESYRFALARGHFQGLNLLMVGRLLACTPFCPPDTIVWHLRKKLGRDQLALLPANLDLFAQGLEKEAQHE